MVFSNKLKTKPLMLETKEDTNDSLEYKIAVKSNKTLHQKVDQLKTKLEQSYDNHQRTIDRFVEIVKQLPNDNIVFKQTKAFLINLVIGNEEDEEEEEDE